MQTMTSISSHPSVVGVDVGGARKGFHAVALENGQFKAFKKTVHIPELVEWCVQSIDAITIAIDAPCRWSRDSRGRLAERQLMKKRISCFSTPKRGQAIEHPKGYYDWMLRGEGLYRKLQKSHPMYGGQTISGTKTCFETYPHAITWHLRSGDAHATLKRSQRIEILCRYGIETTSLTNMDWIDAALCALTASLACSGEPLAIYGEPKTGFIVVPETRSS